MKKILGFICLFLSLATYANAAASFRELNGMMWFYTTLNEQRFRDIQAEIPNLKSRGIRILGIYSPYHGDKEKWAGCDPLDYYATTPASGTLADWNALVAEAHAHGMKVVAYFANIYIDRNSQFFRTAEAQYRAGDRASREVSAFRWTLNHRDPLPTPAAGPSAWKYSETARAYYWSLWEEAGFDFNLAGARAEVERFTKFWLDTGLDGFMWDAALLHPKLKPFLIDIPVAYTPNDKWITFESATSEEADANARFGLTSWFNFEDNDAENDYTRIAAGSGTANALEAALRNSDRARELGRLTHAWSPWEDARRALRFADARMRVQEAALFAGAGITYGAPNYEAYVGWPETQKTEWEKVLVLANANPALHPAGSRRRVAAGSDRKHYAMLRTSTDGNQRVLLVYNFKNRAAEVKLDFASSGLALRQTPKNLWTGESAPAIAGARYSVNLPAWGFAVLEVEGDK